MAGLEYSNNTENLTHNRSASQKAINSGSYQLQNQSSFVAQSNTTTNNNNSSGFNNQR